jgi:IS5 family transposase
VAHGAGALRSNDLKRVTVDTTVQQKAVTFPTNAKLLHAAIRGPNRLASRHRVRLRQSYLRIAKGAAMMAGRYAHAKQFKPHQRHSRILRSRLGRIIRDIRRKIEGQTALEQTFALPLGRAAQIHSQQQRQRGWKLYSFHPRRWSASARARPAHLTSSA